MIRALFHCCAAAMLLGLALLSGPAAAQTPLTGATAEEPPPADEALAPLVQALEDPEARERLIAALREAVPEAVDDVPAEPEQALAARLAEASIAAIDGLIDQIVQVGRDIGRLGVLATVLDAERLEMIRSEGADLALTVLLTVLIYRTLRVLSRRVRVTLAPDEARFGRLALAFFAQFALRALSVLLAWVAGYGLATLVLSEGGIALPQALYLNAFLAFGAFTTLLSVLVSRHDADLTFAKLPAGVEAVIYRNLRNVFGLLFYGMIAAVPIVQSWSNFVVARSLRTIVFTAVAILAIFAIRRMAAALREAGGPVRARSQAPSASDTVAAREEVVPVATAAPGAEPESVATAAPDESLTDTFAAGTVSLWDRIWPLLAYTYVAVAYVMALANPNQLAEIVGRATLLSALALVAVLLGLRLLSVASRPLVLPVPRSLGQMLPTLSARLSGFLGPLAILAALGLFVAAFLLIVEGWRILAVGAWLGNGGGDLVVRIVSVLLILFVLTLAWAVLTAWIDRKLAVVEPGKAVSARSRTLLALFRNAVTIAIVVFGGMTALSELGVDIAPLLAGAGVIGLAVGFGAQKLVQDIITGVFIQLENAINEGDVVTVAGITGGVERLTIRSVGIRDLSGVYHLIPFSAVDTVGNYMRLFAYHVEVVGVAYDSDLTVAEKAMHDAFDTLNAGALGAEILAPLEYHGVIGLGDSSVNLRARIKTKPGQQWAVGRAYTREVKRALDAAGIEIPFPHRELKLPKVMLERLAGPAPGKPAEG